VKNMLNPRDVYIYRFSKPVYQILKDYNSGGLIIPPDSREYDANPVEQVLLYTFRNEFLFTRDRIDMKLTLRTNIPFIRSVIQFANGESISKESLFYDIKGKTINDLPPLICNRFLYTDIHCCIIAPSTPENIIQHLVDTYNKS
jgi:hypothetical protein